MADGSDESSHRARSLALVVLAAIGWLAAGFFWWQGGQTQSRLAEQLTAVERARKSLASDLQNLQKSAGVAADLKKRAGDAEKALSDATAARASAQNELADLTKQISDAKLAISGAQEEAGAKTRDLQAVDARLKDETDRASALQSQDQALAAEETRMQGEADAARKALADAQSQTASAQKQFEALQGQINSATAELNAIQAQIRAAKPPTGSPPETTRIRERTARPWAGRLRWEIVPLSAPCLTFPRIGSLRPLRAGREVSWMSLSPPTDPRLKRPRCAPIPRRNSSPRSWRN